MQYLICKKLLNVNYFDADEGESLICTSIDNSFSKSAFICNQDEISSLDETCPGMKKFLCTHEFYPGMKQLEFHPRMKFNLKENLLSRKTQNLSF